MFWIQLAWCGSIFDNLVEFSVADLAYSAHAYLAKGLAALAIEKAQTQERQECGFFRRRCMQPNPCRSYAGNR